MTKTEKNKQNTLLHTQASVHLEGKTRHGKIVLDADQVSRGGELTMTVQGYIGDDDFYGKMCTGDRGHLVLLHTRYKGANKTMVLADTDNIQVGQISLLNGRGAPKCFHLDLKRLNASKSYTLANLTQSILDEKADEFTATLKENRDGPEVEELRRIFAKDSAYKAFLDTNTVVRTESNWR